MALEYMLGPCSVESEEQLNRIAEHIKADGVNVLRGGTFKMRSAPDSFQGLGAEGVRILTETAHRHGMHAITELTDIRHLNLYLKHQVDIIQVGSRNMYNYPLLQELSSCGVPVLLKRHFSATLTEFIQAAEYLQPATPDQLLLCERGIRSFDHHFRFTFDINAISWLKQNTPWKVIADPSHGTGQRDHVLPVAQAAVAAGADGVLVEVHPQPVQALSDGHQSITLEEARILIRQCNAIYQVTGSDPFAQ